MKQSLCGRYADASTIVKFLQWFGLMFVLTFIAIGIWLIGWHGSGNTTSLKWFQALQTTGTMFLPPLLVAYLWSKNAGSWLKLKKTVSADIVLVSIVLMVACSPLINVLSNWNQQMTLPAFMEPVEAWMRAQEDAAAALTERFILADSIGTLCINVLLMAVLPAMSEELTFRGVFQQLISPKSNQRTPHAAIWATAILFSAVHCQFYGFIPRMLMGAMFGYLLVWTGSLWIPILMHMTNNATAVIGYNIVRHNGIDETILETIGTGNTWWIGVLSAVLAMVGIYFIWRRSMTINKASSRISGGN